MTVYFSNQTEFIAEVKSGKTYIASLHSDEENENAKKTARKVVYILDGHSWSFRLICDITISALRGPKKTLVHLYTNNMPIYLIQQLESIVPLWERFGVKVLRSDFDLIDLLNE